MGHGTLDLEACIPANTRCMKSMPSTKPKPSSSPGSMNIAESWCRDEAPWTIDTGFFRWSCS